MKRLSIGRPAPGAGAKRPVPEQALREFGEAYREYRARAGVLVPSLPAFIRQFR